MQILVVLGFAYSGYYGFRDYAVGFAEGRRAASLAAAPEYVRGRIAPTRADFAASALNTFVTRIVPLVVLVYAIVTLR